MGAPRHRRRGHVQPRQGRNRKGGQRHSRTDADQPGPAVRRRSSSLRTPGTARHQSFEHAGGGEQPPRRLSFFLRHPAAAAAGELALVAVAFLLYFIVRANVVDQPDVALAHARSIIDAEQALGIYHEKAWQDAIIDSRLIVRFFNIVYFWLDFPLIAALGLLLYFTRRKQYTFTRDAILASGLFALFCYYLYPVAPPRLVPETGIIDSLQAFSNLSYQAQSTEFFVNPYAAMPSLHVGWAFLIAIGVAWAYAGKHRWVLILCVLHPLTQWTSTVVTGNHFFLDGVGGLVAAAVGIAVAVALQRWGYPWLRQRLE